MATVGAAAMEATTVDTKVRKPTLVEQDCMASNAEAKTELQIKVLKSVVDSILATEVPAEDAPDDYILLADFALGKY